MKPTLSSGKSDGVTTGSGFQYVNTDGVQVCSVGGIKGTNATCVGIGWYCVDGENYYNTADRKYPIFRKEENASGTISYGYMKEDNSKIFANENYLYEVYMPISKSGTTYSYVMTGLDGNAAKKAKVKIEIKLTDSSS